MDLWLALPVNGILTTVNTYGLAGATSIYDGRSNTNLIAGSGSAGGGLNTCISKSPMGWYVPAAQEFCRVASSGNIASLLTTNGTATSTIQTASGATMGITCWSSGEPNGNGAGIQGYGAADLAGLLDDAGLTGLALTLCVWRP